ncbi:MAG: hypothetical protein V1754_08080 [Pseudomonadota bacterium]
MIRWLIVFALMFSGRFVWSESWEKSFETAVRAYQRGDYNQTIELLVPLLYPTILLPNQNLVIQAHKVLGISYVFVKNDMSAEKEFLAILSARPDYRLDPLVEPVAAVEFFERVKRRNAEVLQKIIEREKKETEQRRLFDLKREEARQKMLAQSGQVIEREIEINRYWINYVPLGVGQFQNGHRKKGFALMGTQLGMGAVSIAASIWFRAAYPNRLVPPDEADNARALNIIQVASGALFFAAVAYGIVDALVYYEPKVTTERRYWLKPKAPNEGARGSLSLNWIHLVPVTSPKHVGLGLFAEF